MLQSKAVKVQECNLLGELMQMLLVAHVCADSIVSATLVLQCLMALHAVHKHVPHHMRTLQAVAQPAAGHAPEVHGRHAAV
jgi:hypothetical protein